MKKLFFLTTLAFLSLCSFTSLKATPFHYSGTDYFQQDLYLCNGDVVTFYFTVTYDVSGQFNNNRALYKEQDHYTATGTDYNTGEVYTLDTYVNNQSNEPVSKGAFHSKFTVNETITGDQGGLQATVISAHETYNANGTLTVDKFSFTPTCH